MTATPIRANFDQAQAAGQSARPNISATPYLWREPSTLPVRQWLYGRWFLRGTIAGVVAPGGIGKSTMLAGTALAMASGQPLLGKTTWEGPKRVWLWNLEDDLDELSRSIQASAKHFGITADDVGDRLFVDSGMEGAGLCTATEEDGFRLLVPVYGALRTEILTRGIDVLIVDPFVSSHEVEENSNSLIDKVAKAWGRLAKETNSVIILVHHTSKAGAGEVTALSARGAVALINACRATLVLNRMDKERAEQLGISDDDRRRYFSVEDDKHNRAPAEKADWYRLASVDLDNGDGEHPGDSVGVAEPWQIPDPFDNVTAQHLLLVQQAIDRDDFREDAQAKTWAGHAVANVLDLDLDDKGDKGRVKRLLAGWIKTGALAVETKRDPDLRKDKRFIVVGEWLTNTPAPPSQGVAAQGVAVERPECATTTLPPKWRGCRSGGADAHFKVAQNGVAQSPADEPIEGWDDDR